MNLFGPVSLILFSFVLYISEPGSEKHQCEFLSRNAYA